MKRIRLTQSYVKSAKCEKDGGKDIRWSDSPVGFGLRLYSTGKKSYVVSYRVGGGKTGTKRLMTLSDVNTLSLPQARNLAKEKLGLVALGNDPLQEKKEMRQKGTFGELSDDCVRLHLSKLKSSRGCLRRLNKILLPKFKNRDPETIKRSEITELHFKLSKRAPYEANRLVDQVRKMFNLASDWGYVPENHVNPGTKIQRCREEN